MRIDTSSNPEMVPEGHPHGKHSHERPHYHFYTAPGSKAINGQSFMQHVSAGAAAAGAVTLFVKGASPSLHVCPKNAVQRMQRAAVLGVVRSHTHHTHADG